MTTRTAEHLDTPSWPLWQRVAFRLVFAYTALFIVTDDMARLPGLSWLGYAARAWALVISWLDRTFLHFGCVVPPLGGSRDDMRYSYLVVALHAVLAITAAAAWSWVGRRHLHYRGLHAALRVAVRYVLGFSLLGYGLVKVIPSQFASPSPHDLITPLGELRPKDLMWVFMGASRPYGIFAGAAEVIGAALLLSRRTTTLGALVLAAVMSNVVAMDLSYDVPVKHLSIHLLVLSMVLVAPDAGRLVDVLVRQRPVDAPSFPPYFAGTRTARVFRWGKVLLVGYGAIVTLQLALGAYAHHGDSAPLPPLAGLYRVDSFVVKTGEQPLPFPGMESWRTLVLNRYGRLVARTCDAAEPRVIRFRVDEVARTITFVSPGSAPQAASYTTTPERLTIESDAFRMELRAVDPKSFALVSHRFRWTTD